MSWDIYAPMKSLFAEPACTGTLALALFFRMLPDSLMVNYFHH
jgi:hypothetical protein